MPTKFKTLVEHGPKTLTSPQVTEVLDLLDLPATLNVYNLDQLVLGRVKNPQTGAEEFLVKAREWRLLTEAELQKATEQGAAPSVYGVIDVAAPTTPQQEPEKRLAAAVREWSRAQDSEEQREEDVRPQEKIHVVSDELPQHEQAKPLPIPMLNGPIK